MEQFGIGDDEAAVVAAILLLQRNGIEMRGVDFGNEQRNVGIHAVIARVADDRIAGAGEVFFGGTGDGRIERGKNEVAIERRIETFDDEAARGLGDGTRRDASARLRRTSCRKSARTRQLR